MQKCIVSRYASAYTDRQLCLQNEHECISAKVDHLQQHITYTCICTYTRKHTCIVCIAYQCPYIGMHVWKHIVHIVNVQYLQLCVTWMYGCLPIVSTTSAICSNIYLYFYLHTCIPNTNMHYMNVWMYADRLNHERHLSLGRTWAQAPTMPPPWQYFHIVSMLMLMVLINHGDAVVSTAQWAVIFNQLIFYLKLRVSDVSHLSKPLSIIPSKYQIIPSQYQIIPSYYQIIPS